MLTLRLLSFKSSSGDEVERLYVAIYSGGFSVIGVFWRAIISGLS